MREKRYRDEFLSVKNDLGANESQLLSEKNRLQETNNIEELLEYLWLWYHRQTFSREKNRSENVITRIEKPFKRNEKIAK